MSGNPAAPGAGGFPLGVGQVTDPYGAISPVFTQLAFDPRINKQPLLQGSYPGTRPPGFIGPIAADTGLTRGAIVQAQSQAQAQSDNVLYGCSFLFNPSLVTLQHGIDNNSSLVLPQYRRLSADTGVYVIGLASTLDISVFFDRTYEVNTAVAPGSLYRPLGAMQETKYEASQILVNDDPRVIGVEADIKALYRVVGMADPIPGQTWANDPVNGTTPPPSTVTLTGPMQQVPCYLMLGASLGGSAPSWYGYIDSIGVTLTHFSQGMIPMRAQVDIEMTLLPSQT